MPKPMHEVHAAGQHRANPRRRCPDCQAERLQGRTWQDFMEPPSTERVPLEHVAEWWGDVYAWRTAELERSFDPYDADPGTRVPNSTIRTKFLWLREPEDWNALWPLLKRVARRRRFADFLRTARHSHRTEGGA